MNLAPDAWTEPLAHFGPGDASKVRRGANAAVHERPLRAVPDARQGPDGKRRHRPGRVRRGQRRLIVRLVQTRHQLGEHLVVRDAGGHSKAGRAPHRVPGLRGDRRADPEPPLPRRVRHIRVRIRVRSILAPGGDGVMDAVTGVRSFRIHRAYVHGPVRVVRLHDVLGGMSVTDEGRVRRGSARGDPPIDLGGQVHPALVQAELLAGAEPFERGADLLGARAVRRQVLAADERHLRAQRLRLCRAHQLLQPRAPGGVVGGDDEELLRHRHGSSPESRVAELLNLAVERVHVEVRHDPSGGVRIVGRSGRPTRVVVPPERRRAPLGPRAERMRPAVDPHPKVFHRPLLRRGRALHRYLLDYGERHARSRLGVKFLVKEWEKISSVNPRGGRRRRSRPACPCCVPSRISPSRRFRHTSG